MVHLDDQSRAVSSSLEISDWGEQRPQLCFRSTGMAVSMKNCQALLLQMQLSCSESRGLSPCPSRNFGVDVLKIVFFPAKCIVFRCCGVSRDGLSRRKTFQLDQGLRKQLPGLCRGSYGDCLSLNSLLSRASFHSHSLRRCSA